MDIQRAKVCVVGAGNVGAEVARRLVEKNLADVVLLDVVEGLPQGKALDITQAAPIMGYQASIIGTNDYRQTANADVVVITAGLARKPGMSRDDLLHKNAQIIKSITENIVRHSPSAVLLIVTNPLDSMTYLAWKVSGFPKERVLGMAPLLDAARMEAFIAMELKVAPSSVKAMVLGTHGDLMVPIPNQTTVNGKKLDQLLSPEKIRAIVERTQNGGAEIVNLLKSGSAYYAPSAATAKMVEAILSDHQEIISSSVLACGQYGLDGLFIGLPARLGKNGVEEIIALPLTADEQKALWISAQSILENNQKLQCHIPQI